MAKEFNLKDFLNKYIKNKTVTVSEIQAEYSIGFLPAINLLKEIQEKGLGQFKSNLNKFYFDEEKVKEYLDKPEPITLTEQDIKDLVSIVKYIKKRHSKLIEKLLKM